MTQTIIAIITTLLAFAGTISAYYIHIKKKIEETALDAINKAEELDTTGQEKFNEAVNIVMEIVPTVLKPFITRKIVEDIVQKIFDKVDEFAIKQVEENKQ